VTESIGFLIVGLFAIGMAIAFFSADPHSPTSRALALFLGLFGATMLLNIPASSSNAWLRFFSLAEIAIMATGLEWGHRIGRMGVSTRTPVGRGSVLMRFAQGSICVYGIAGALFPDVRREVWNVVPNIHLLSRPGYYLFAVPFDLAWGLGVAAYAQAVRAGLDPAERLRLLAAGLATPFFCTALFAPRVWKPVGVAVGEAIFLIGAIRYHVLQGQRGQFLSRFVSPDLAGMVRERGLGSAMQRTRVDLSVVACDLRGFTAFAETGAPEEVMKLLEDYYSAVGEVVSEFGGSIKDFAGDGILALVGAPIAHADHAQRAVGMALKIRERGEELLGHWNKLGLDLGLGVGVASGFATVGAIGGTGRLEYGAVGPVVNLASRLASRAVAGQVLAEPRVVGMIGDADVRFEKIEAAELKGFARPVNLFAVWRGGGLPANVARP
jgi:adenylate cyclase